MVSSLNAGAIWTSAEFLLSEVFFFSCLPLRLAVLFDLGTFWDFHFTFESSDTVMASRIK